MLEYNILQSNFIMEYKGKKNYRAWNIKILNTAHNKWTAALLVSKLH
jgi:hypothetical protein